MYLRPGPRLLLQAIFADEQSWRDVAIDAIAHAALIIVVIEEVSQGIAFELDIIASSDAGRRAWLIVDDEAESAVAALFAPVADRTLALTTVPLRRSLLGGSISLPESVRGHLGSLKQAVEPGARC